MPAYIDSIAYRGETPWHGIGTRVEGACSWEEFYQKAGLAWDVRVVPAFFRTPNPFDASSWQYHKAEGQNLILRSDTRAVLGTCGKHWKPLQNSVAFKSCDRFASAGLAEYHTGGSIKGGEIVWCLMEIKGVADEVVKGDELKAFLLVSNGHNGKTSVSVQYSNVRVVCWNTFSQAMREAAHRLTFSHKGDVETTLEAALDTVNLAKRNFEIDLEQYKFLASRQVRSGLGDGSLDQYFRQVLKISGEVEADDMPRAFKHLRLLYPTATGHEFAPGSYWHAFNTVTEYVDHARGHDSSRLGSAWFGEGRDLKQRALFTALEMAKAA